MDGSSTSAIHASCTRSRARRCRCCCRRRLPPAAPMLSVSSVHRTRSAVASGARAHCARVQPAAAADGKQRRARTRAAGVQTNADRRGGRSAAARPRGCRRGRRALLAGRTRPCGCSICCGCARRAAALPAGRFDTMAPVGDAAPPRTAGAARRRHCRRLCFFFFLCPFSPCGSRLLDARRPQPRRQSALSDALVRNAGQ